MPIEELLCLEWNPRTIAFYEHLKAAEGEAVAHRYLEVSYAIDCSPRPTRELDILTDPFCRLRSPRRPISMLSVVGSRRPASKQEASEAMQSAILALLHPQELPMTYHDIEWQLLQFGYSMHIDTIQRHLKELVEAGRLRRMDNPYRGNTFVYCHADFRPELQSGDRVLTLIKSRAARVGQVLSFKTMRHGQFKGQKLPLVDWQFNLRNGRSLPYSGVPVFADPSLLILIER